MTARRTGAGGPQTYPLPTLAALRDGGRGFDIGKRPIPEPRNVQISFTLGRKYYFGADLMSFKMIEVMKPEDGDTRYIIHFIPDGDYVTKTADTDLEVPNGERRRGYLGARR